MTNEDFEKPTVNGENLCNGCGACCLVIPLSKSKTRQLHSGPTNEGYRHRRWLRRLVRLTYEQARSLLPTIELWTDMRGMVEAGQTFLYTCKDLDRETGRCLNYENRPSICRGFPAYGRAAGISEYGLRAFPNCGFRALLPEKTGDEKPDEPSPLLKAEVDP